MGYTKEIEIARNGAREKAYREGLSPSETEECVNSAAEEAAKLTAHCFECGAVILLTEAVEGDAVLSGSYFVCEDKDACAARTN